MTIPQHLKKDLLDELGGDGDLARARLLMARAEGLDRAVTRACADADKWVLMFARGESPGQAPTQKDVRTAWSVIAAYATDRSKDATVAEPTGPGRGRAERPAREKPQAEEAAAPAEDSEEN